MLNRYRMIRDDAVLKTGSGESRSWGSNPTPSANQASIFGILGRDERNPPVCGGFAPTPARSSQAGSEESSPSRRSWSVLSLRTSRRLIRPGFLLTNGCAAARRPPADDLWIRGFKSRSGADHFDVQIAARLTWAHRSDSNSRELLKSRFRWSFW